MTQLRWFITGASTGFGRVLAETLLDEGDLVVATARKPETLTDLVERHPESALALPLDVTDHDQIRAAVSAAVDSGGIDVLVNNAGVLRFSALLDMEPPDFREGFTLGTQAMLVTTQAAARAMIGFRTPSADCAGKVINIAGVGGTGGGGQAHYAASKAAVMALTRAAAYELGPHGITVNCLCPGYSLDDLPGVHPDRADSWSALSPLGRLAEPHDVARAALFLASSDSDYLTGDALNICGGMQLH
jgi:NAD(P)-dependent dehydrogenase (short-subunit alcohol dehydrogenase family)